MRVPATELEILRQIEQNKNKLWKQLCVAYTQTKNKQNK